jgi:DNA-binding LytR/AlgR family response regulator
VPAAASPTYRLSRAPLGLILLDQAWIVRAVSDAVPGLLDLGGMDLVGRALLDLHPPDLRGRVEALLRAPGETPAARAVTIPLRHRTLVLKIEPLAPDGPIALVLLDPADLEAPPSAPRAETATVVRIPVDAAEGIDLIDPAQALYVRAAGHYCQVRMPDGERFCSLSLKDLEGRLEGLGFTRVHRTYLVNLGRVRALRRKAGATVVELEAPVPLTIPVGRSQAARLRTLLAV